MSNKTYNGWSSYETWNVALWMDNDENSHSYWEEIAQEIYDEAEGDATFTRDERAALDLMARLKDHFEEQESEILKTANIEASMWADLLGAALSEVNWHEIAQHKIDDLDKDEQTETA